MYGRAINFTLLAPSLWSVVEAVAQPIETDELKRNLFKSSVSTGWATASTTDHKEGANRVQLIALPYIKNSRRLA